MEKNKIKNLTPKDDLTDFLLYTTPNISIRENMDLIKDDYTDIKPLVIHIHAGNIIHTVDKKITVVLKGIKEVLNKGIDGQKLVDESRKIIKKHTK